MMTPDVLPDTTLEISRTFAAPREKVFAAWMDPAALQRWYRMADDWEVPVAEVDFRVGGAYRIGLRPPGRDTFFETGTFREIVAHERIVYTNELRGMSGAEHEDVIVTVTFREAADGGTVVTVREEGFPSAQLRDMHAGGWPGFLDHFAAILV